MRWSTHSRQMKDGEDMAEKRTGAKERKVKKSLTEQLELQNKTADFYMDLVEDYMSYWRMKEGLVKDIENKGLRYACRNGNGIEVEKPNESVQNLQKTTTTMLKILSDLNLKEPLSNSSDEEDYL